MFRSRILFFGILGVTILAVVVILVVQSSGRQQQNDAATVTAIAAANQTATALVVPVNPVSNIVPIYAKNAGNDNLPRYVCAADAFGSYYALQQMQVAGYDVKNGFHLGIVPFGLAGTENSYDISEEDRSRLLQEGKMDCLFTTLDSVALKGQGVITAVIDESAGADQLWVHKGISTFSDLRGKRIAYSKGSVGEFFMLYLLAVADVNPRTSVSLVPADDVASAVKLFNAGQADVVSGWQPDIEDAKKSSGTQLIGSDKLRVIIDVIVTSRTSLSTRARVVQQFHNAWFQTLKAQFEDFSTAAKQIAGWGYNDWSAINPATAENDLGKILQNIAQAGLTQNSTVMQDPSRLVERLNTAARVWTSSGQAAFTGRFDDLVNPQYVMNVNRDFSTTASPRNNSFLLGSRPNLREIAPNEGETLAVLPCRKFEFLPESAELTSESQRVLDECAYPVLASSLGLYLRVVGSAAWPGPAGTYQEKDITEVAQQRAQAVVDYLVKKGLDRRRFNVSTVLPPPERRNTTDTSEQAKDRFVEMTLITVGR